MSTASQLRTGPIQLEEKPAVETRRLHDFNAADARLLAKGYRDRGRGPLSATASYDQGDVNGLRRTREDVQRAVQALNREGVREVRVEYVPVSDPMLVGQVVFAYQALNARAPDHCTRMPGYQGAEDLDAIQRYQISCESKSIMSEMIVRPEDLLGRSEKDLSTARRAGGVVEFYQDGEPNELFSEVGNASEIGQ